MRMDIFSRSALRRPIKLLLLVVVTALISAAFISRASQYLLIRQETERLGSYYKSVLSLRGGWQATDDAVEYLSARRDVDTVNTYRYVSGVMQEDFRNADTDLQNASYSTSIIAFYGVLRGWDPSQFYFDTDQVEAGYPEYITEGRSMHLLRAQNDENKVEDPDSAFAQLEKGERYLVIGVFESRNPLHVVVDKDGSHYTTMDFFALGDNLYFLPVPEGQTPDWSDPELRIWQQQLAMTNTEQRALNMIAAEDMSVLPEIQQENPDIYLADGRWLNREDHAQGRRVCVIHAGLALMRGLKVGDTLTIGLRDLPSTFMGYFIPYESQQWELFWQQDSSVDTYEIVGVFDYLNPHRNSCFRNNAYIPASAVPETFRNVGITALNRELYSSCAMYCTSDLMPQPDQVSFTLTSPDHTARFLVEARSELADMGYEVEVLSSDWDAFQAAAGPMQQSALINTGLFAGILAVVACLTTFLYFRMSQRDIAIARALGVPARQCIRGALRPILLIDLLGAGCGALAGWWSAIESGEEILQTLSEFAEEEVPLALPAHWLLLLWGGVFLVLLLLALCGGTYLSTRPVLELLQNGRAAPRNAVPPEGQAEATAGEGAGSIHLSRSASAPGAAARTGESLAAPVRSMGLACTLWFAWRQILRARLRTTLTIVLAAGFTVGLAAIELSIAENQEKIDQLYKTTEVRAELVKLDTSKKIRGGGFIRWDTIEALLSAGYVTDDVYLEGASSGTIFLYKPGMEEAVTHYIADQENMLRVYLCAFNDEEDFLSPTGSGSGVTITYLEGWDRDLFAEDWTAGEGYTPIVVPKEMYHQSVEKLGLLCKSVQFCEIAGYYEGTVSAERNETYPILLPLSVYQEMGEGRATYSRAHVTLNPKLNRELSQFTNTVTEISSRQLGVAALQAVVWDQELRLAVAPLENNIQLMRVLFPVTLVLSLLVAAGIAGLFVMISAKEVAIMRVLGTSRLRSRLTLAVQMAFTSAFGLALGLGGVLAYAGRSRPDLLASLAVTSSLCAALYLLLAVLGSVVSASIATSRNPLELLQVKE